MKTIFKAVATVTIFSIITRLLGFFFRIFLSRKLGAEGLGLFQMASSILGVFMTLIASGIPLTTAKMVSKYEISNQVKNRNKVVSSALVIALFVAVLSSFIILVLKHFWNLMLTDSRAVEILIILIPSIIFSAVYAIFRGALWGKNDFFSCGLTELLEQIIRFVITFIVLLNVSDIFIATKNSAIAFNLTCLISALITIIIYLKKGKLNFKTGEYKAIVKSALPITGVRLANSLVQPLTTLIIPNMLIFCGYSTTDAVSSFGVIMGMTFPMLFVPMTFIGSLSMVLIPSISAMMTKNDYNSIEDNITSSLNLSIFISMLFIPIYLSVGDLIGLILFNNAMSGILLQLSAICILPISLCNLTGSLLNALNLEVKSFVNYLIGSCVLFVSLISLTPLIGINSIIISFFLSMTTISLLNLRKIKKVVPNLSFKFTKTIFKYMLAILPSALLGKFISNISLKFLPLFFSGVFGGLISLFSTLILCNIFNLYSLNSLLKTIINKKSKSVITE